MPNVHYIKLADITLSGTVDLTEPEWDRISRAFQDGLQEDGWALAVSQGFGIDELPPLDIEAYLLAVPGRARHCDRDESPLKRSFVKASDAAHSSYQRLLEYKGSPLVFRAVNHGAEGPREEVGTGSLSGYVCVHPGLFAVLVGPWLYSRYDMPRRRLNEWLPTLIEGDEGLEAFRHMAETLAILVRTRFPTHLPEAYAARGIGVTVHPVAFEPVVSGLRRNLAEQPVYLDLFKDLLFSV